MTQDSNMPSGPSPSPIPIYDGFLGSSGTFFRVKPGVVLKAPVSNPGGQAFQLRPSVAGQFLDEKQILIRLGDHPRITRYLGWSDEFPTGLLFVEASHGNLQRFLDNPNRDISPSLREKFYRQAIEAVGYIHSRGVIHSDLRPDIFLVHGTDFDLMLCDFGGSACEDIGIPGTNLPDDGFFHPDSDWKSTPSIDMFALGSREEVEGYGSKVNGFFKKGIFPDTKGLYGGEVILGCWTGQYSTVDETLRALDALESLPSNAETR